jgi:hypothetical protein
MGGMNHVMVVMQARSGSSLLTKIFHKHGLWLGECRKPGRDYETYENAGVMGFLDRSKGSGINPDGLRQEYLSQIPPGQRGVLKTAIQDHKAYLAAFPEADFVYMVRDAEAVSESLWRKGRQHLAEGAMLGHATLWNDRIYWSSIIQRRPLVEMSRVLEGDLSSLKLAMKACGMKMRESIVEQCIDRTKWRCQPAQIRKQEAYRKHMGKF